MATAALVSVSEYLNTTYRPDRELLDGQPTERNVGEYDHSNLQGALVVWMRGRQHEWNIRVLPEQRIQVTPGRFRVPDLCVVSRKQKLEPVFTEPPLICIEILSKQDTLQSLQERIDDYRVFGVPNIWVLNPDPAKPRAYVCMPGGFREPEGGVLEVPDSAIRVPLSDLFSELG
jgi:Uma2 family endonuclease